MIFNYQLLKNKNGVQHYEKINDGNSTDNINIIIA